MLFQYLCRECEVIVERDFRVGNADPEVVCPECKGVCSRHYGSMTFILKGGGWPGKTQKLNQEMTSKNEAAGRRMRGQTPGMRTVAYDYGDGDVRDVKDTQKPKTNST